MSPDPTSPSATGSTSGSGTGASSPDGDRLGSAAFDEFAGEATLAALELGFSDWFRTFHRMGAQNSRLDDLIKATVTAPTSFLQGYLFGMVSVRMVSDFRRAEERAVLSEDSMEALAEIGDLGFSERWHAGWYAELDTAGGVFASTADLRGLLATAPTDFLRGLIHGALRINRALRGGDGPAALSADD